MFVGYAMSHAADVYLMWDPYMMRVHTSRDVVWLNRMYYDHEKIEEMVIDGLAVEEW